MTCLPAHARLSSWPIGTFCRPIAPICWLVTHTPPSLRSASWAGKPLELTAYATRLVAATLSAAHDATAVR